MVDRRHQNIRLNEALEATGNIWLRGFAELRDLGLTEAIAGHAEIENAPTNGKSMIFYRRLLPLRRKSVALLAETYRLCLRLALAHPQEWGPDPRDWARAWLQPAVHLTFDWIRDWYVLTCDGQNQWVRRVGPIPVTPGQTVSLNIPTTVPPSESPKDWRAPAWLFEIFAPLTGIGLLKTSHVPANKTEERLGGAYTRVLLRGARRVFLWELREAIEIVGDEETAAAGTIPGQPTEDRKPKPRSPKGFEGLSHKKADLSKYTDVLTEKQAMAFSLKYEYGLQLSEIASRMAVDRKTAYEHIESANRKIQQAYSNERRKAKRADNGPE